jgi:hypothetical protein
LCLKILKKIRIYPSQNLPAGVATRLASGEKIAPELYENVAVVFVGVAGRLKHYNILPLYIALHERCYCRTFQSLSFRVLHNLEVKEA